MGFTVLQFENMGWDWGGFYQFARWQMENDTLSDAYLFLHDDIDINKQGFIREFINKTKMGYQVVGNSPPVQEKYKIQKDFPEDVFWANTKGISIDIPKCRVVRGSCFYTTKNVVENVLLNMPVKTGTNILFANSSLRVFGAMVCQKFGIDSIGYISDTPRTSSFINEHFRGHETMPMKYKIKSETRLIF